MRTCTKCGVAKPLDSYHKNSRQRGGLATRCKECANAAYKAWRESNPESFRAAQRRFHERNPNADRDKHLRRKYGINSAQYDALLESQGGVCALCRKDESVVRRAKSGRESLAVDHCHETGRVRGLLCFKCNTALGVFNDDPERLRAAIAYLDGVMA